MWTEITRPKYDRTGLRYASDLTEASLRCPTPTFLIRLAAQMSGTIDTLTAARKLEAADLSGTFKNIRRDLDVILWMLAANLAMTSVILGIVLTRLFQP